MTGRRQLDPAPAPGGSPFAHLLPLVQTLLDRGNRITKPGMHGDLFAPSQGGYVAYLADPIDWDWLQTEFELPPSLHYDAASDQLFDRANWVSVKGSQSH